MKIEELKEWATNERSFWDCLMFVFFEAMLAGYAGNSEKGTIPELPGSKMILYARGPWKVIDTYHVNPLSTRSGGTTIISYDDIPVWMMQYFGEYNKDAIPCLKAALRDAYKKREFYGGRGQLAFARNGFMYQNFPNLNNGNGPEVYPYFFSGKEEINNIVEGLRGWHRYQGGLMI